MKTFPKKLSQSALRKEQYAARFVDHPVYITFYQQKLGKNPMSK